jgi:regulator of RNase E activity RraA
MRNPGDLAQGFPLVAGSVEPSHGFVHVTDPNVPVTVFGLMVRPGELVDADYHGAVAVPLDLIGGVAAVITKLHTIERIVPDAPRAPGLDFAAFEAALSAFEKARV